MLVQGYFTIERNILGLTPQQMETRLGFRPGRLTSGAHILVLQGEPNPGEFESAGSTWFPDGRGLNREEINRTAFSPGAWLGQRLVKVQPNLPHSESEYYPVANSPVEQWKLKVRFPAYEVRRLAFTEQYWPSGSKTRP